MNNDDLDSPSSLEDYYTPEAISTAANNFNGGTDDETSNSNGFNVTIEEAVFKYIRGIELDYNNNIPEENHNINIINNNDTIVNSDEIHDYQMINQHYLPLECGWNLMQDKNCESSHLTSSNKRNLDETNTLPKPKRIRLQNNTRRKATEKDSGQRELQSNWITMGSDLLNSTSYEPMVSRSMVLPTLNAQNEVYQSYSNLLMSKHYQNILPKIREVEDDDCVDNDQSNISKTRELRKLVEKCVLKVSQVNQSSKSQKDIILEEERIIKGFIQRYQEIYELTYYDIRSIILNDHMNEIDMVTSEGTINHDNNNCKVDIKIIDCFWSSLYKIFPGHLHLSLNKRIRGLVRKFCKTSKWTNEEDKLLQDMCTGGGLLGRWTHIGYLLNRTPEDCRNRWRDYGICQGNHKKNQWTTKEEEQLFTIIVDMLKKFARTEQRNQKIQLNTDNLIHDEQLFKQAINWNRVSKCMGYTRSRIQCQYKWKKLLKRRMLKRINDRMTNNDIRRVISMIENKWTKVNEIDWYHLSSESHLDWYAKELELFFNTRLKTILNHEQLTIKEVCREILEKLDG